MPTLVAGAVLAEYKDKPLIPTDSKLGFEMPKLLGGGRYMPVRDDVTPIVYMPRWWMQKNKMKHGDHMTVYQRGGKMVPAIAVEAPKGANIPTLSYSVSNTLGLKAAPSQQGILYIGHPGTGTDTRLNGKGTLLVKPEAGYYQHKGNWLIRKRCINRICAPRVKRTPPRA